MQTAAGFWESEAFWNIAFTFLGAIAGGVVTVYLTWKLNKPESRTLEYQWRRNYAIPDGAYGLQKPRIVDISIFNPTSQSITADSFHQGHPIEIELDGYINAIVGLKAEPNTTALPGIQRVNDEKISIQPFLLRPRQRIEFSAVIDGDGDIEKFKFVSPLTDIDPELLPDENQLTETLYARLKKQANVMRGTILMLSMVLVSSVALTAVFAIQKSENSEKYWRLKNCLVSNQGVGTNCWSL